MTPAHALIGSLLACFAGALVTAAAGRRRALAGWLAFASTVLSSSLALYAATTALLQGPSPAVTFLNLSGLGFALRVYVDGLSAVFIGLVASIALPAALFSIPYMEHYRDYSVRWYYPTFLLFLAAMYGLVSTTDMMWFFFIFWQLMTWPGYFLIRFEHRKAENVRAANKYLLMMQIACALTMVGAELLAISGATAGAGPQALKYDFDSISQNLPALLREKPGTVALAFALFLTGFGIKMGMWPFGALWLPDAHPAAPSPVSAMLSGVMIKTGVYGLMRYFLWLVPSGAQGDYPMGTWGLVIAGLGTVTLLTGTLQALKQEETKRLLAFHSIGQIGYILLGVGVCLALLPGSDWGLIALATLGFLGALFHTINHGIFKSLLFLNAGAMIYATDTQNLNRLGGLMRYMPVTAVTALVASCSIAGVPLFNGFASKWSLYVAAIQGGVQARYLPLCAAIAILTSALTLASFVKFFGASFLSRTSAWVTGRLAGRPSLEVNWMMRLPQLFLASLCLALGLAPALAFLVMGAALESSRQGLGAWLAESAPVAAGVSSGLVGLGGRAVFVPLIVGLVLVVLLGASRWLAHLGRAQRRPAPPWLCGYVQAADEHRYVAHGFYAEFKRCFAWMGANPPHPGGMPGQPPPSHPTSKP